MRLEPILPPITVPILYSFISEHEDASGHVIITLFYFFLENAAKELH